MQTIRRLCWPYHWFVDQIYGMLNMFAVCWSYLWDVDGWSKLRSIPLVMLETNIPKSICSKLQIWMRHYFLVILRTLVPKYICSKFQIMVSHYFSLQQKEDKSQVIIISWLLSLFPTQIYILKKCIPNPAQCAWRAHKNYPTYIHPPTVGMIYLITKNFPKLLAAYFHYFKNVYSPTLPPNAPTNIPSDEYPTPT